MQGKIFLDSSSKLVAAGWGTEINYSKPFSAVETYDNEEAFYNRLAQLRSA